MVEFIDDTHGKPHNAHDRFTIRQRAARSGRSQRRCTDQARSTILQLPRERRGHVFRWRHRGSHILTSDAPSPASTKHSGGGNGSRRRQQDETSLATPPVELDAAGRNFRHYTSKSQSHSGDLSSPFDPATDIMTVVLAPRESMVDLDKSLPLSNGKASPRSNEHYSQADVVSLDALRFFDDSRILRDGNRHAVGEQLIMHFLYDHFPARHSMGSRLRPRCETWLMSRSGCMATAINCLLILHHPQAGKDPQRYQLEQRKLYCLAIKHLKDELNRPEAVQSDSILGAIDVLRMCGQHQALSLPPSESQSHAHGLMAMIRSRGPAMLDSEHARYVVLNALPMAVMQALSDCQPTFFAEPDWQAALEPYCTAPYKRLIYLACRVPGPISDAYALLRHGSSDTSPGRVAAILIQLHRHDSLLRDWLLFWYCTQKINAPYWTASDDSTTFSTASKAEELLQDDHPFAESFMFYDEISALTHISYWCLLLAVKQCILKLADHPQIYMSVRRVQTASLCSLKQDCGDIADAICCATPYLLTRLTTRSGMIATYNALDLACQWYAEDHKNEKKMECALTLKEDALQEINALSSGNNFPLDNRLCTWMMMVD